MIDNSRQQPDSEQLSRLNEQLRELIRVKGLTHEEIARYLQGKMHLPRTTPTGIRNALNRGDWQPQVLYEICRLVDYPPWQAAEAIGVLPESPADWIEPRMQAGSLLSVDRYLQKKEPILGARAGQSVAVADVIEWIRPHLPSGYCVLENVEQRGRRHAQDYHTYLIFTRPGAQPQAGPEAVITGHELRTRIDAALREAPVSMHWEPSRELKPPGHEDDEVLIVESYFDNQAPLSANSVPVDLANVTPLVVLGVYYSGAKDIVVLLHRQLGLAAMDISRYVGQLLQDTEPFRSDLKLQRLLFWNLAASGPSRRLILTVDDYHALLEGSSPKPARLPGAAVLLRLDPDMLDYAAYRVASSRLPSTADPADVLAGKSAALEELSRGQDQLQNLMRRHFRKHLPTATISRPDSITSRTGAYPDLVDEMFDIYCDAATKIAQEVNRRR